MAPDDIDHPFNLPPKGATRALLFGGPWDGLFATLPANCFQFGQGQTAYSYNAEASAMMDCEVFLHDSIHPAFAIQLHPNPPQKRHE